MSDFAESAKIRLEPRPLRAAGAAPARTAFGAAQLLSPESSTFTLNLRLPGQYFDAESGLHYNRQRYYDPQQGQYLTPDPLGTPDGPNPYAYVAFNPLGFVDPDGLILFAFDGTGNTDDSTTLSRRERQTLGNGLSNVVHFVSAYNDGAARYVSGVGTTHVDSHYGNITASTGDAALNRTGVTRIDRMMRYFEDEATNTRDQDVMQIDIVGFSRGAAQARDFANQMTTRSKQISESGTSYMSNGMVEVAGRNGEIRNYYRIATVTREPLHNGSRATRITNVSYQCQLVNFRFIGLWDTVLSTNSGRTYNLTIPSQFAHVAQAVALNEYRSQPAATWNALANRNFYSRTRTHLDGDRHWGGFPLESIGRTSSVEGQVRIERGFIGAHADIGGGYGEEENQLATVALNWMVGQAQTAGVAMNTKNVNIISGNPVIHDGSNMIRFGNPQTAPRNFQVQGFTSGLVGTNTYNTEDRLVRGGLGGGTQRTQVFGPAEAGGNRSMTNADTHQFITYTPRPDNIQEDTRTSQDIADVDQLNNQTGTVNMQAYISWLRSQGYALAGARQQ